MRWVSRQNALLQDRFILRKQHLSNQRKAALSFSFWTGRKSYKLRKRYLIPKNDTFLHPLYIFVYFIVNQLISDKYIYTYLCIFFVFLFIWSIYLHIWQHKRALWISWRVWDCWGPFAQCIVKMCPAERYPKRYPIKQMFLFPQKLWTQLIGVSFFFFQKNSCSQNFHSLQVVFSMSDIFSPPFYGKKNPCVFSKKINAYLFRRQEEGEEASEGEENSNEGVVPWGSDGFFSHPQKNPRVMGGHHRPEKNPLPVSMEKHFFMPPEFVGKRAPKKVKMVKACVPSEREPHFFRGKMVFSFRVCTLERGTDTSPLPSGTFESMMFLLPFGGFWDRFLEGTRTGG